MFKNEFECLHKIRENIKNKKKYSKQDLISIKKNCQSIVDSFDVIDLDKIEDVQYSKICYICKDKIKKTHSYYSEMCFKCGNFNQFHRDMIKPLSGKVADLVNSITIEFKFSH